MAITSKVHIVKINVCPILTLSNNFSIVCLSKCPVLDVAKIYWKNCLTALKGQFQGHEKYAAISMESMVDTNLWFWHAAFGFPGMLNDLNTF